MKKCQDCGKSTDKGYSKYICTGQNSKKLFYCDPCYETGIIKEAQDKEFQRLKTRATRKESNRRD